MRSNVSLAAVSKQSGRSHGSCLSSGLSTANRVLKRIPAAIVVGCLGFGILLCGCGLDEGPSTASGTSADTPHEPGRVVTDTGHANVPPSMSIRPSMGDDDSENSNSPEDSNDSATLNLSEPISLDDPGPEKGTAEWILAKITKLQKQPILDAKTADEVMKARLKRNREVVVLATEAIKLSHNQPGQESMFRESVRHLMNTRIELAQHDPSEVDALYNDCDLFLRRARKLYDGDVSKSQAAADASFAVVRFSHIMARDFAKKEPRWLTEFVNQARRFGSNFPNEGERAVPLLFSAGWSCELHGKIKDAIGCYTLIWKKFPESSRARQSKSILRRLMLKGRHVKLGGPTKGGDFVSIKDFKGTVVIVVFWASDNRMFLLSLPKLKEIAKKYKPKGVVILGVCLDEDEEALNDFLKENPLDWTQIFHPDTEKRRWDNPIVSYYGIHNIPMLWLIDREGVVVDTQIKAGTLEKGLEALLEPADDSSE